MEFPMAITSMSVMSLMISKDAILSVSCQIIHSDVRLAGSAVSNRFWNGEGYGIKGFSVHRAWDGISLRSRHNYTNPLSWFPVSELRPHKCERPRELRRVDQGIVPPDQEVDVFVDRVEGIGRSSIGVRLHAKRRDATQRTPIFVNDIIEFGFTFRADEVVSS